MTEEKAKEIYKEGLRFEAWEREEYGEASGYLQALEDERAKAKGLVEALEDISAIHKWETEDSLEWAIKHAKEALARYRNNPGNNIAS